MSEKEVYGVIYVIENKINGKKYVGQTIRGSKRRFAEHIRGAKTSTNLIGRAINKYGHKNFVLKEVDKASCLEDLNNKEREWIINVSSRYPLGYNLTDGGDGSVGYKHTYATRQKMRLSNAGTNNGMYGKNHTIETKNEIGRKTSRWIELNGNAFYGKKHSLESREKIKKSSLEKVVRKIICLDNGEIFASISEASEKYNIARNHISAACSGKYVTSGGFKWAYYEDYIKGNIPKAKDGRARCVVCVTTGEVFKTSKEAAIKYGLDPSSISKVCRGKYISTGGLNWQYYEEYLKEKGNRGALNGD